MKYLICGKGPSLLRQLKNKSLDEFDKVVRVNYWEPIKGYDNRCDIQVLYPPHHLGQEENQYDIMPFMDVKEIWIAHEQTVVLLKELTGREPSHVLHRQHRDRLYKETGLQGPRTGILAIWMAMLLPDIEIYTAGYDFYQEVAYIPIDKFHTEKRTGYYFKNDEEAAVDDGIHPPVLAEKEWYDKQVENKIINVL